MSVESFAQSATISGVSLGGPPPFGGSHVPAGLESIGASAPSQALESNEPSG